MPLSPYSPQPSAVVPAAEASDREQIGLIGLGLMGSAMAERFLARGFEVLGFDIDPASQAALVSRGGRAGASVAQLAASCRRIILSLPNSDAVQTVIEQLDPDLRPGQVIMDATTGPPEAALAVARRLAGHRVPYVEAMISGNSSQVRRGEVLIIAGGAAEAIAQCDDLFGCFASRVLHCGDWCGASRMKLVINLVLGLNRAVLAEGLAFAGKLGLDLVRYADTIGYHGDVPISVWPYRDYVIRAFNENPPFDRFTREQLAGDLLPDATERQKVASTFNRLNRMSTEGGIQDKEYLAKYAADRVRTASTTWLGSTMGCAECHDHKFDPFSARDFYSMAAFFADLKEQGFHDRGFSEGNWGPKLLLPSSEQRTRLEKLDAEIAALKKQTERVTDAQLSAGRTNWEAVVLALNQASNVAWKVQSPLSATTLNGATLTNGSDNIIWASGKNPDNDTYTITFKPGDGTWRALRLQTYTDEQYAGNRVARGGTGFIVTEAEVLAGNSKSSRPVKLAHVVTSAQAEGFPALAMLDGRKETGWAIPIGHSSEHQAAFHFAEPLITTSNTVVILRLRHDHYERKATIGKFRLGLTAVEKPLPKSPVRDDVLQALRVAPEKRDDKQRQTIAGHYRTIAPELTRNIRQRARLQAERSLLAAEIPSTLVSEIRDKPRAMRVLPRGDWMNDSDEMVQPAVPHFLPSVAKAGGDRATRLDLANWFTSKQNPLTARAFVNRLWKIYFGTGLTRTLDDLGTQGEWPTHLELLDWLACEFMDSGWDVKHLVRLIVTSGAYRQSSTSTPALDEKDPLNRLLARQSRLRLDAELVRDYALSVSGLLVPEIGGPSVRPYQPEGYYAPLNFPKREYTHDRGAKLYRRTLYTHMQRTFPHPLLMNFDASGREECTAIRMTSNTPLQALNLLNDPIFVEAARVLAANIMERGGRTFEKRLNWAYQRALTRDPNAREIEMLRALFDQQLTRYRTDTDGANELLRVGEAPVPKGSAPELAAWTSIARAILNLNEVVTRN